MDTDSNWFPTEPPLNPSKTGIYQGVLFMNGFKTAALISCTAFGAALFSSSLVAGVDAPTMPDPGDGAPGNGAPMGDFLQLRANNTNLTINPGETQTAVARCEDNEIVVGGFYNLRNLLAGGGNSIALDSGSMDVVRTNIDQGNNRYSVTVRLSSDAQGAVTGNARITATCAPQLSP